MVRLLRWIGFLMTVFRNALIGAAGASAGGGGGGGSGTDMITSFDTPGTFTTSGQIGWSFTVGASDLEVQSASIGGDYTAPTGTEVVSIWRVASENLVGQTDVAISGGSGENDFPEPIQLVSGEEYAVVMIEEAEASRDWQNQSASGATFAAAITYEEGRSGGDEFRFPSSTAAGALYGVPNLSFTETTITTGATTTVSRSPSTISTATSGTSAMFTQFTPDSDTVLVALEDDEQPTGLTGWAYVYRVSDQAIMGTTPRVTKSSGVTMTATFLAPITLKAGVDYLIGWYEDGTGSPTLSSTTCTWSGFTVTNVWHYGTLFTYPTSTVSGYWITSNLIVES